LLSCWQRVGINKKNAEEAPFEISLNDYQSVRRSSRVAGL
jgi:hypothetical protein